MQILKPQQSIVVDLTMAGLIAFLIFAAISKNTFAQAQDKRSALVVRVAVFSSDQGRLDNYRDFIDGHLFPTLRLTPGYVGAFLGRDPNSGQLISLSFWRSEADAVAGEEAVGRAIRALPPGSAPRPVEVQKYVVEYRDVHESFLK
jgi:hypothetical protein